MTRIVVVSVPVVPCLLCLIFDRWSRPWHLALTGSALQCHNNSLCAAEELSQLPSRKNQDAGVGAKMEASDGTDLAARSSMEAKEYWVHLDAEGPLEKYPGQFEHRYDVRSLIFEL